ncbi:hypothetical protein [Bacillus altitudinis]|uniref:hypothetical protein n=1 Tax=Bacillus altitudinis TaxID=293387 RepID=UPI0020D1EEB2|nr:hypothetical protein [Bacillus altitudinis]
MALRNMKNTLFFALIGFLVSIFVLIYLDKIATFKIETGVFKTEIVTKTDGEKDQR